MNMVRKEKITFNERKYQSIRRLHLFLFFVVENFWFFFKKRETNELVANSWRMEL
jgi:hypothetical protein